MNNNSRNRKGQFEKGHSGFKPKGAISRKALQEQNRMMELFNLIDQNLEEDILKLAHKERIQLWLRLAKSLKIESQSPDPQPESENPPFDRIIFEVIHSDKSSTQ
jgi:hypothetical protein